jgi:hypothetical protein
VILTSTPLPFFVPAACTQEAVVSGLGHYHTLFILLLFLPVVISKIYTHVHHLHTFPTHVEPLGSITLLARYGG